MAKLGIMIEGQEGLSWERWRALCTDVEALGFASLRRSDEYGADFNVARRESAGAKTQVTPAERVRLPHDVRTPAPDDDSQNCGARDGGDECKAFEQGLDLVCRVCSADGRVLRSSRAIRSRIRRSCC